MPNFHLTSMFRVLCRISEHVLSLFNLRNRVPIIEERHACRFALFLANAYAELGLVKSSDDKITGSRHRKGLSA